MPLRNTEIKTAALYARVSLAGPRDKQSKTEQQQQKKQRQETENQLRQLREYCRKQGWKVVREYVDRMSGKRSDNRAEFQTMMTDASRRRFDVVVVWALDRLSREGVHQTFSHIKTLKSYGVEFESHQEREFRTTGEAGELMMAIAAWIAKQERIRISERTKAGLARAVADGQVLGRRPVAFDLPLARKLRREGKSLRQIAKATGVCPATVLHRLAA
jgi:DNA invertase Pin-like site-specific DNA recombinase